MYECRIRETEFPKVGEIVVTKTFSIENDVLTMKLIEYGDLKGLVLNSELSKKKIKSINQVTKIGSTEVCQVLTVDKSRGYIDLSLKAVGEKEKKECLDEAKKNKVGHQIMQKSAKLANVPVNILYEEFGYDKINEYGSLYRYFVKGKTNPAVFEKNKKYGQFFLTVINEEFRPSAYKVRGDVDVTSHAKGVEGIIGAFAKAAQAYPKLKMVLLKPPTYSITNIGSDKNKAIEEINSAFEIIRTEIEKSNGTFHISLHPRVYGEKNKHMLLEDEIVENKEEDTESDDF